jgi:hypothetical protein
MKFRICSEPAIAGRLYEASENSKDRKIAIFTIAGVVQWSH